MARLRLGVLISGRGSNLQALLDAAAAPDFPAEVALVISNKSDAAGLGRADAAGVPTRTIPNRDPAFENALDDALRGARVELVCLAGFMRVLTASFVERWRDRLINIHPSLLPAFPGLDTHRRALEEGVTVAGCTVHFVRAAVDAGPIIAQARVPILPNDDETSLAARVLTEEHRLYPETVRLIAEGRVRVDGETAIVS
jgi:phosphoribosylglycinamide formyltransferase 1